MQKIERPECEDCGRPILTRYCMVVGSRAEHRYMCWNCVTDRRMDSAEEFDLEGFGWD